MGKLMPSPTFLCFYGLLRIIYLFYKVIFVCGRKLE